MSFMVYFTSLLLKLFLVCHQTDALFMWTAPPPAWNQTVAGVANIQTAVIRVVKGSIGVPVRWNYTLLEGQSITFTFFRINDGINSQDDIGFVLNGGSPTINDRLEYKTRFSLKSTSEYSTLTINRVTEKENATFQCKIQVGSKTWAYNVRVEVTVPPKITYISADRTVSKGDPVTLDCRADGYPAPIITWTKVSNGSVVTMPLTITGKQDRGAYRCTADNGVGNPASKDVSITVHTPPVISKPKESTWKIMAGGSATIECLANADPSPRYVWTNAAGAVVTNGRDLNLRNVNDSDGGNYICTATNNLGSDKRTVFVLVTRTKIYGTVAVDAEYKPGMKNINSEIAKEFGNPFKKEFDKLNRNTASYKGSEFIRYSNGSIIVYFVLHFKIPVTTYEGTINLRIALKRGTIGPYKILSLKTVEEFEAVSTTLPSASTTVASPAPVSPGERVDTDTPVGPPWIIIGAAVGGAVVLVVIIGVVVWRVRKNSKHGGSEAFSRENEVDHSDIEHHTHEQRPPKRPGEVLYADLGDLNPRQAPKKSTHPEPVPPIKRPVPYARTDYAEITHFIKADDTVLQEVWPRNGARGSLQNMQLFI